MRTRVAVLGLLLILCLAAAAAGLAYWFEVLNTTAIGSIALLAGYGVLYVINRWWRE